MDRGHTAGGAARSCKPAEPAAFKEAERRSGHAQARPAAPGGHAAVQLREGRHPSNAMLVRTSLSSSSRTRWTPAAPPAARPYR